MTKEYMKEYLESLPKHAQPRELPRFSMWSILPILPFILLYLALALCIGAVVILGIPYLLVTWAYGVGGILAAMFVAWLCVSVLTAIID